MPLLLRTASHRTWTRLLLAGLAPIPLSHPESFLGDPCGLEYKAPSYDRRVFAEMGSGFAVPLDRTLPYVFTPRLSLIMPLDEAYHWNLSGSAAVRFGDSRSAGTLGARLYRSIFGSSDGLMPGFAVGLGPDLVLAHDGGMDAVAEVTVDLTPVLLGARVSWGPVKFNDQAFTRPARLETFIGWRVAGWRRKATALEALLRQPPPPRRRFHPHTDGNWARDYRDAIEQLPDATALAYLSLVQQLMIRLGAQFKHGSPDCGTQLSRLEDARQALNNELRRAADTLRHGADSLTDVRYRPGLDGLLREQSNAFATSLAESLEYAEEHEDYRPDAIVLGPAMMHAIRCVLDGALSSSCVNVRLPQ
jgi:hypothetical protein